MSTGWWSYSMHLKHGGWAKAGGWAHLDVMLVRFAVFSHPGGEGAARIGLREHGQTGQRGLHE